MCDTRSEECYSNTVFMPWPWEDRFDSNGISYVKVSYFIGHSIIRVHKVTAGNHNVDCYF